MRTRQGIDAHLQSLADSNECVRKCIVAHVSELLQRYQQRMTRSTIDRIFQSGQDFVQEVLSTRECDEPEQAEPERKRRDLHFCGDKRPLNKSDFIGSFWETSTCVRHESKAYGDQPERVGSNRPSVRRSEQQLKSYFHRALPHSRCLRSHIY